MLSDIEIAQQTKLRPITDVAHDRTYLMMNWNFTDDIKQN